MRPLYFLDSSLFFPPVELADSQGLLAVGGDLSVERLKLAYNSGIFPWYGDSQPILWWSPDPRMVLFPEKLKVSKSMKQVIRKNQFRISFNEDFKGVVNACAEIERADQDGTWITGEMKKAYLSLHLQGLGHSVEVWENERLVGGIYGIYLRSKKVFCGESMFSKVSNASKLGLISLVRELQKDGVRLIDCQIHTPHLESLGAQEIPRQEFLKYLGPLPTK